MHPLEKWSQIGALTLLLLLGIEGFLFEHNVAAQARLIGARQAPAQDHFGTSRLCKNSFATAMEQR